MFFTFRACACPFASTKAKELEVFQAPLLAPMLDVVPDTGEDIGEFCRGSCRRANTLTADHGLWSVASANKVVSFDSHIERNASRKLWPALLQPLRNAQWLTQRRSNFVPITTRSFRTWSVLAGRTNIRMARGSSSLARGSR